MAGEHLLEELGRFDGDAEILQAWRDGMAPESTLLVSEWADRHRMLGSRDSAEPNPYRTSRTPYLREVMVALSPAHSTRRVVFIKSAQVGATTCGSNWIGYARAAAAALGMDSWGEGRWARMADALSLPAAELPTGGNVAPPSPPASPDTLRPRGWLAPRSGWLR